jgi:hypothetical protein
VRYQRCSPGEQTAHGPLLKLAIGRCRSGKFAAAAFAQVVDYPRKPSPMQTIVIAKGPTNLLTMPIQISTDAKFLIIPTEMRRNNLFLSFCRVAFLALFVCLWSCEGDLFDSDSKEIAHGYRLKRIGSPGQFALLAPYDTGGLIIDEIGWRKIYHCPSCWI